MRFEWCISGRLEVSESERLEVVDGEGRGEREVRGGGWGDMGWELMSEGRTSEMVGERVCVHAAKVWIQIQSCKFVNAQVKRRYNNTFRNDRLFLIPHLPCCELETHIPAGVAPPL